MLFPCRKFCPFGVVFCFMLLTLCSAGQNPAARPSFIQPTLRELIQQSGFIFAGTVTKVESAPANAGPVAALRITFRVEQAILGVREGEVFEVREWAGLWNFGEHYRVGEHVVLFLYPPSRLGLTSPVGGASGRFCVTSEKQVLLDSTRAGVIRTLRSVDLMQPTTQVPATEFVRAIRGELREQSRGQDAR